MTSEEYWNQRYESGGNSGSGSYGRLADFKAVTLNAFVQEHGIQSVIEFGCGDGHQLWLARYPQYLGLDISQAAIARCRKLFARDASKRFEVMADYKGETAELALSLDVIYHLLEHGEFAEYMRRLFYAAMRFVVIYSTNYEQEQRAHTRHHKFTDWVEQNITGWRLVRHIPNRYPLQVNERTESDADFYIYAH